MNTKSIAGRVIKVDAEAIIVFRVGNKYYPSTNRNKELFETYLHTGDPIYLNDLEQEVQL